MNRYGIVFVLILLICGLSAGCVNDEQPRRQDRRLVVVTTLFPLFDFARNIGRDDIEVRLLLPPGVEPHSFEPTPADAAAIARADVFVYTGRFMEPWAENLLKGLDGGGPLVIDAGRGIALQRRTGGKKGDHGLGHVPAHERDSAGPDPHIWLDFSNVMKMVETIGEGMASRDPGRSGAYARNAKEYNARIRALDETYRNSLSRCGRRVIVHGGHFAFNYLAARYDLKYLSAYRGGGDTEPTPRDVADLIKLLRSQGLRHVFYEELVSPRLAETIAREAGGSLLKLHGAHNVTKDEMNRGVTFISLMQENLDSLRTGLLCQ